MSTDFVSYLSIFDPRQLQEDGSSEIALEVLEGTVDPETVEAIVKRALEVPHALEFILSGVPAIAISFFYFVQIDSSLAITVDRFEFLSSWILDGFPEGLEALSVENLRFSLLSRLANFLNFLPYPTRDDEPQELASCARAVDIAPPVLVELGSMLADPSILTGDHAATPVSPSKRKIPPPRGEKRSQAARRSTTFLDPQPFRVMDVHVPTSSTEAESLAGRILLDQKSILKVRVS